MNLMITQPTLIIDTQICLENIRVMAQKAKFNNVTFRPHFKTHQSNVIAEIFKREGVTAITVSSVTMAQKFIDFGFNDVTIAFPVNILEIEAINALAKKAKLNLLAESLEVINFLGKHLEHNIGLFVKIDAGYGRTGVPVDEHDRIDLLLDAINNFGQIHFRGFLAHFGNTYQAENHLELAHIFKKSMAKLMELYAVFVPQFPEIMISIGDTPSCCVMPNFAGVHEIRPGNFTYFDATQMQIGSCQLHQVAAIMACPVVAVHPERNQLIIYGGAVHFSKEQLATNDNQIVYGLVVRKNDIGIFEIVADTFLKKLSQEHGVIEAPVLEINKYKVGSLVYIVPVHSCLTANLMKDQTLFI